jgi:hypothetical protein
MSTAKSVGAKEIKRGVPNPLRVFSKYWLVRQEGQDYTAFFLCKNVNFGSLDVSVQRACLRYD